MGGLSHLFDLENRTMAKKVISHKKHVDGLEAPRNSLEPRFHNSQTYSAKVDSQTYGDWPGRNCYPFEASMKKLIHEEISKPSIARQNSPSIVARLMGVDMSSTTACVAKPIERKYDNSTAKVKPRSREHPQEEELQRFKKEFEAWQAARLRECSQFLAEENLEKVESLGSKKPFSSSRSGDFERSSSEPTRIVILRPGPENDNRESWSSSPCSLEPRGNIEDFLEEVRDRLRTEMQGKTAKRARGSGIETPYSERAVLSRTVPKQSRDRETSGLVRSEWSRSCREAGPRRHSRCYSVMGLDNGFEKQARSIGDDRVVRGGSPSPRSLVRSLSAPVAGTSFGKLLLEDRHVVTGAQIRRRLEGGGDVAAAPGAVKKRKKEKSLSFRERVSNFRGRLFGKKIPSVMESCISERFPAEDLASGPTVVSNFGERHERDNFTEVPPSPASVCSSSQEELSSPDITPCDDYSFPRVFREISSNLTELRRQLNELESDEPSEEEIIEPKPIESEALESKDPAEAYVRDLLVASGLYDRSSSDRFLWKWETLSKPISASVFEEVEERYKKSAKDRNSSPNNHRLLHDLLNEALPAVLRQPSPAKLIGHRSSSPSLATVLRGKELLHCVWEIVGRHLRSQCSDRMVSVGDIVVDDLVARDLRLRRWSESMDEIVASLGREMESVIMEDLVEEILVDMKAMN